MAFLYTLGWIAPLFHVHPLDVRLTPDEALAPHSCGAVEHHIPLASFHGCDVCWQASQRVSLPAMPGATGASVFAIAAVPEPHPVRIHKLSLLLPDKRGPPTVA